MGEYKIYDGQFSGCHIGDATYNYYITPSQYREVALNIGAYRSHIANLLVDWGKNYTPMDIVPLISVPAEGLRSLASERISAAVALQDKMRVFVVGSAGTGKTALLKFLQYQALVREAAPFDPKRPLCIYIELGRFRAPPGLSALQCLLVLCGQAFHDHGATDQLPSLEVVQTVLGEKTGLLLLDGLNEVHPDIRKFCLDAIKDLASRFPNIRYVVTARPHEFTPPEGWSAVMMCDLGETQIDEFLTRYIGAPQAESLRGEIQNIPLLRIPPVSLFYKRAL